MMLYGLCGSFSLQSSLRSEIIRLPILVLLVLLSSQALLAQGNTGVAVVMSKGSGYSNQIVVIHNDIPWVDIRGRFQTHFSPIIFSGSGGGWVTVISQGVRSRVETARLDGSPSALEMQLKLQKEINEGQAVTAVEYGAGKWISASALPLEPTGQRVLSNGTFPKEEVDGLLAQGWGVATLDYGGTGEESVWLIVMERKLEKAKQSIVTGEETFPLERVRQEIAAGKRVVQIGYGNGSWFVVLDQNHDLGEQLVFFDKTFPKDSVENAWLDGYQMTSIDWPTDNFFPTLTYNNLIIEARLDQQADPSNATWYDQFLKRNQDSELGFVAMQRIAGYHVARREWGQAKAVYQRYQKIFPSMSKKIDAIIEVLDRDDTAMIHNIGEAINTYAGEFMPIPNTDNSTLYFTGMKRIGGKGGEDIFVSKSVNGTWERAESLGGMVNTPAHEFATSISPDNNRIVLFSSRISDGLGRGDLYYSDKGFGGFGILAPFPKPVNSVYWDCDGFLTSDGRSIIFASDRPGGVGSYQRKDIDFRGEPWGNTDLWVSTQTDTGWSEPINLGETINTSWAERSPFLHPDGKTLYFASSGHPGLGKLDVFVSTRLKEDSWTEWSEPVNLGKAINGVGSDWGYRVNTAGTHAYFAAEGLPGSKGGSDIYVQEIPEAMRPQQVATIRGIVTDTDGNPLQVTIKWEDLSSGKEVGRLSSDAESGKYFVTLPLGKNYGYFAEKEGYYPVAKSVDLRETEQGVDIEVNIQLTPIETIAEQGTSVRLNNIFFDTDKSSLKPESEAELSRFARMLGTFPSGIIEISGHTDSVASDAYNRSLSQRRAQSVVDYLVTQGIPRDRLIAKGYGEEKPVADNGLEEGRALNRRVEFRFLRKSEIEALKGR